MSAKNVLQQKAVSQSSSQSRIGWSPIKPVSDSVSDRIGASLSRAALLKSSRLLMSVRRFVNVQRVLRGTRGCCPFTKQRLRQVGRGRCEADET